MQPRWEYRVWGKQLDELHQRLQALCEPTGVRTSDETYVVGITNLNAKIRFGVLDVKRLIDVQRGFQLWTPILKAGFPIPASTVAELLQELLGSSAAVQEAYGLEEFLTLAGGSGAIVAAASKHRHGYRYRECLLEFAEVTIDRSGLQTVAVEFEDLTTAVAVAAEVGIDRIPNESYPEAVRYARTTREG